MESLAAELSIRTRCDGLVKDAAKRAARLKAEGVSGGWKVFDALGGGGCCGSRGGERVRCSCEGSFSGLMELIRGSSEPR